MIGMWSLWRLGIPRGRHGYRTSSFFHPHSTDVHVNSDRVYVYTTLLYPPTANPYRHAKIPSLEGYGVHVTGIHTFAAFSNRNACFQGRCEPFTPNQGKDTNTKAVSCQANSLTRRHKLFRGERLPVNLSPLSFLQYHPHLWPRCESSPCIVPQQKANTQFKLRDNSVA